MNSFTPGPWVWIKNTWKEFVLVRSGSNAYKYLMERKRCQTLKQEFKWSAIDGMKNDGEILSSSEWLSVNNDADRSLIAAAPDLYESCLLEEKADNHNCKKCKSMTRDFCREWRALKAKAKELRISALAKARGENEKK